MTFDEIVILSEVGVSLHLCSDSPIHRFEIGPPAGTLLRAFLDGKGTVTIFDEDGNKHPLTWKQAPFTWANKENKK